MVRLPRLTFLTLLLILALTSGCGDDDKTSNTDTSNTDTSNTDTSEDTSEDTTGEDVEDTADVADMMMPPPNPDCDPLMPTACSLPWPSSQYLVADDSRETGYTLTFGATSLPANALGTHIDPKPYERMDGYGLGVPIMVAFPDVDLAGMATEENLAPSVEDADASVLLFEVTEGGLERVPYWVERDVFSADREAPLIFIRPAVILKEKARYIVALRGLNDSAGAPLAPSEAFVALRDGATSEDPLLSGRQARFDEVFTALEGAGIQRDTLTLAWDFTTASSDALHGPLRAMITAGFAATGPTGPEITVTAVERFHLPGEGTPEDEHTALRVEGTIEVPHYMKQVPLLTEGVMGWVFNEEAGEVVQNGTRQAGFWVTIPHAAMDGTPQGLMLYGHGLLGEGRRAHASFNRQVGNDHGLIVFSADLVGMAESDTPAVVDALQDLSHFPVVADRLHQGILEYHLLTRAMRDRFGELSTQIEATLGEGALGLAVDTDQVFYSGISQGGIFGGTLMATSPDVVHGHLGVPGNNYATLLHRSVDFTDFFDLLRAFYRNPVDQAIALGSIQLLWDGVDPVSYLSHVTADPFEGDPRRVLMAPAKGDWQVSVMTNEVAARSNIEIPLMDSYDVTRTPWGAPTQAYPHEGSGVVLYDHGNPWPEPGNSPPDDNGICREDLGEVCDPHELPRRAAHHQMQMVHFFRTGEIIDVCGGDGCTPD